VNHRIGLDAIGLAPSALGIRSGATPRGRIHTNTPLPLAETNADGGRLTAPSFCW
jgi:hypothetical protein